MAKLPTPAATAADLARADTPASPGVAAPVASVAAPSVAVGALLRPDPAAAAGARIAHEVAELEEKDRQARAARTTWGLAEMALDAPGLYVVAKRDGFRRAGLEHRGMVRYPLDGFTGAQLAQLAGEEHLQVFSIGGEPVPNPSADAARTRTLGVAVGRGGMIDREHEAAVAIHTGAADAGIKARAARDAAIESDAASRR